MDQAADVAGGHFINCTLRRGENEYYSKKSAKKMKRTLQSLNCSSKRKYQNNGMMEYQKSWSSFKVYRMLH